VFDEQIFKMKVRINPNKPQKKIQKKIQKIQKIISDISPKKCIHKLPRSNLNIRIHAKIISNFFGRNNEIYEQFIDSEGNIFCMKTFIVGSKLNIIPITIRAFMIASND